MPKEDKLKIEALKLLEKIKESEEAESKKLKNFLIQSEELNDKLDHFGKLNQILDE